MAELVKAQLEQINHLADQLGGSAGQVRGIDVSGGFSAVVWGLAGSDVAGVCADAAAKLKAAYGQVAERVDVLARANRDAGRAIGITDEEYGHRMHSLLNLT